MEARCHRKVEWLETPGQSYRVPQETAAEYDTDLRTAAFVLAIRRVGRAALSRVHVGKELPF